MDEAKIEAALSGASDLINPRLGPAGRQAKIDVWSAAVNSVIGRADTR
jgi:hypothetical protein